MGSGSGHCTRTLGLLSLCGWAGRARKGGQSWWLVVSFCNRASNVAV